MSWRQAVAKEFEGWPDEQINRAIHRIAQDNDHAERLGFTCHPDDRLGYGRCYFTSGMIRVWHSPEGWCRSDNGNLYEYHSYAVFHSQSQALRNMHPFARFTRFGEKEPIPLQRVD